MQEIKEQNSLIIGPRKTIWVLSTLFFLMVLAASGWLFFLGQYTKQSNGAIQDEITEIENQIEVLSKERKVLIANIIKNNTLKPSLDLWGLIGAFKNAASLSNVRLKGFSVSGDTITTTLIATEGDSWVHPDPAATIIKMMRTYALWKMDFNLDPIYSISGDATYRTTGIQLRVVPKTLAP